MLPLVLVSWGGRNKTPQTTWLKTTEMDSLTVLEAGSPKSASLGQDQDVSPAALLTEALRPHSAPLLAPGRRQHSSACGCTAPISASFGTSPPPRLCVSDLT